MELSTVFRNSVRGMRIAWTFTPSAYSAMSDEPRFLSSTVTRTRSISDLAHTVSWDRLPHRIAATIERSLLICSTSASSARLNSSWTCIVRLYQICAGLLAAQSCAPRRIEVIRYARSDHLHAANKAVLNPKRLGDVDARCAAGERAHVGDLSGVQLDLRHGAIHVEHAVGPDNAAFFVDERKPPVVDIVDDAQIAALELLLAIQAHVVEAARRCRIRARSVCRVRSILDAVAVVSERVKTLAVVLLHRLEVGVGDCHELLPRRALRRWNRLQPERLRLLQIVHGPDIVRSPASRAEIRRLDLGDPPQLDAQPHSHKKEAGLLAHRPYPSCLPRDRICKVVVVVAPSGRRLPEPVADFHDLFLLGVFHVRRQRQPLRIMCHYGIDVLIDQSFQTGAVAIGRDGANG